MKRYVLLRIDLDTYWYIDQETGECDNSKCLETLLSNSLYKYMSINSSLDEYLKGVYEGNNIALILNPNTPITPENYPELCI